MTQIIRSVEIRATPSKVWRQLASQDALRRWISPNLDIDLQVGGQYRFLGPDQKTWVVGTVLELVPEGWLILSWTEEGQNWMHPARLVVALEACSAGTKVTVIHDGFAGIGRKDWQEVVLDYRRGAEAHQIPEKIAALVGTDEN